MNHLIEELTSYEFSYARVGVFDIDGQLRSKLVSKEKLLKILSEGFGFCNVINGWDMKDECYPAYAHTGYPDEWVFPDPETCRFIPWQENRPFVLADFNNTQEGLGVICPRSLLRRIGEDYDAIGILPKVGMDIEWFNFWENSQSLRDKGYSDPLPITRDMFGYSTARLNQHHYYVEDLLGLLNGFDIPIEGLHTETGDGVYEAALSYREALSFADNAALFKASVKEIANNHGITASFMAKWNASLPGCSGHLHQSLHLGETGQNLLFEEGELNELGKHFLAGQLFCLPYILPMYAPTINSYKRYIKGSWSATTVSWGKENRTTAIRVVPSRKAENSRIEMRVPGADANPYLSISAALASGLYGIKHKLSLDITGSEGSEYEGSQNAPLPHSLETAIEKMKSSDIPCELFGATFVEHFLVTREWECEQYKVAVTDWERRRYLETI